MKGRPGDAEYDIVVSESDFAPGTTEADVNAALHASVRQTKRDAFGVETDGTSTTFDGHPALELASTATPGGYETHTLQVVAWRRLIELGVRAKDAQLYRGLTASLRLQG